jgi:hypothetical protein
MRACRWSDGGGEGDQRLARGEDAVGVRGRESRGGAHTASCVVRQETRRLGRCVVKVQ